LDYSSFLASRGYVRVTVERTTKQPGDLILGSAGAPVERVPDEQPTVVAIRSKRAGRGASS
jgi:hypothetical protein